MALTVLANNFDMDTSSKKVNDILVGAEKNLQSALDALGTEASPSELANFQAALNKYSVLINLTTSMNKAIKDSMSGIIQKM